MVAPKKNKYALGHGKGAPEKYTKAWIEKEAKAFLEWMKLPDSIFFKSFAIERGYSPQRFAEFAEKSQVFSEALRMAKEWQESRLISYGLFNKTNASLTKFVLSNCHDYTEKNQVSGNADHPLALIMQQIDGASKDLVDE